MIGMDDVSSFCLVFGNAPHVRILDFLLTARGLFDCTLTDIADGAGVSWATANALFPEFVKLGIAKETRCIGRARLYAVNEQSPLVRELARVHAAVADRLIEAELARQAARRHRKSVAVSVRSKR